MASTGKQPLDSEETFSYSALYLNIPFGVIDSLTGIFYYDWENRDWYRYASWQRTFDKWRFIFDVFWNPHQLQIHSGNQINQDQNLFGGRGLQVRAVYNY
jgi:hypothetical protein